jgi:pimeloyl-ACP methyl ester carboxylesterase
VTFLGGAMDDIRDAQTRWPKSRTAALIIHGIGEQLPFEMLDSFAGALWNALEIDSGGDFVLGSDEIRPIGLNADHCIVLRRNQSDLAPVEFHEYYWADKAERLVNLGEIADWLVATSEGAQRFYKENEDLCRTYEQSNIKGFSRKGIIRHMYLKELGWLLRLLSWLPSSVVSWFTRWLGPFSLFLNPLFRWIRKELIDYIGDIVIYTASDVRSKFHSARESILDGAVQKIQSLLLDPAIDEIVVAGHSLGSVIAFDAMNRINRNMNMGVVDRSLARKFTRFVTFGSPLDKIAFFFREHTPPDEYLRRQILQHHHSFKARPLDEQPNPRELADPFARYLDHVWWSNLWDRNDPVSGHLDFYDVDENIEVSSGKHGAAAHHDYLVNRQTLQTLSAVVFPGMP